MNRTYELTKPEVELLIRLLIEERVRVREFSYHHCGAATWFASRYNRDRKVRKMTALISLLEAGIE